MRDSKNPGLGLNKLSGSFNGLTLKKERTIHEYLHSACAICPSFFQHEGTLGQHVLLKTS